MLDLEAAGIKIIQIDEAALREKLPPVVVTGTKTTLTGLFQPPFGTPQQ